MRNTRRSRRYDLKKRKLYRAIIVKSGRLVSSMDRKNWSLDSPSNWTEQCMRIAVLYKQCRKVMGKTDSIDFIIDLVGKRREIHLTGETVRWMIQIGKQLNFCRYWKWLWHTCFTDMQSHAFHMLRHDDDIERAADRAGISIHDARLEQ